MLFSTWVDALKYCCPVLASETDIGLVFNYFFTQNNKSRPFLLQKWRFSRNTCCVLIFNEIDSSAAQRDVLSNMITRMCFILPRFLTSPVMSSTHHELQSYSYLIHEGGFGCRACWHVGLVQVKSPVGGKKMTLMNQDKNTSLSSFPSTDGSSGATLRFWEK